MIERNVKRLVDQAVSHNVLAEKERPIIEYGLNWAINCFGSLVGFVILGFLVGFPNLIVIGAVVGGVFRFFSGGAHLDRPLDCFLLSSVVLILSGYLAKYSALLIANLEPLWKAGIASVILAIGLFFGLRIIDIYAPAANEKRPIVDPNERQRLKHFSFIFAFLILMSFIFAVFIRLRFDIGMMIMSVFMFQLFSLTPLGFTVFASISNLLEKIRKEEGNSNEKANS